MDKIKMMTGDVMDKSGIDSFFSVVSEYGPKILAAIITVIIGYILATVLKKIIVKITKKTKLNKIVAKSQTDEELAKAGIKMDLAEFLGNFVKWLIIIATLLIVADIFGLREVTDFLSSMLGIMGRIVVALVVFAVAVYAARFAGTIALAVAKYVKVKNTSLIANIASTIIYFFAALVVLDILQIDVIKDLVVDTLKAGVYAVAFAAAIAFGLGGQEKAKDYISKK